jgi:hypothetical protein
VSGSKSLRSVPEDLHEWVSFEDPHERRTWQFDVTFLASNYSCIFGNGCKGVLTEDTTALNQGCCSYGAHLSDKADKDNLLRHAKRLTADDWQHKPRNPRAVLVEPNTDGVYVTKLVDDACIFLNRPGFEGGAGCALHIGALRAGERFLDWKPEVCWQVPLRRDESTDSVGWVTTTLREWKRRDWGDGGAEFHWWCTESADAFVGKIPVWKAMKDELIEMSSLWAYEMLSAHMADRKRSHAVPLPHPAVRRRAR